MKRLLIVIVLLYCFGDSYCQDSRGGLLVGYNASRYRNNSDYDVASLNIPGLFLGYHIKIIELGRLDIDTGIGLTTKGNRLSSVGDLYINNVFVYIELPVLIEIEFFKDSKISPFLYTGPSLNAKLVSFNWTGFLDDIKIVDFCLVTGIGLRLDRISLSARYTHGLSDFDSSDYDIKLRNSTLSMVFGFDLGK